MSQTRQGRCLCGAVNFKVHGQLRDVIACHCIQCRKQTGHYWAATSARTDDISLEGGDNLTWFTSSPGYKRGFCKTCGSALFWEREGAGRWSIGGGAFDNPTGLKLAAHIYCADKGDYYEIGDETTHFPYDETSVTVA